MLDCDLTLGRGAEVPGLGKSSATLPEVLGQGQVGQDGIEHVLPRTQRLRIADFERPPAEEGAHHLNIHELQTIKHHNLPIAVIVMNNGSYGIIKQFQDSYCDSRYTASRDGFSLPDFGRLAEAYGIRYARIENVEQMTPDLFMAAGPILIDVILSEHTLIEPKLEMGRPINDQYPYLPASEYASGNCFVDYPRSAEFLKVLDDSDPGRDRNTRA